MNMKMMTGLNAGQNLEQCKAHYLRNKENMSSSITENLEEAFVVESQTNQKYCSFAIKCEKFVQV